MNRSIQNGGKIVAYNHRAWSDFCWYTRLNCFQIKATPYCRLRDADKWTQNTLALFWIWLNSHKSIRYFTRMDWRLEWKWEIEERGSAGLIRHLPNNLQTTSSVSVPPSLNSSVHDCGSQKFHTEFLFLEEGSYNDFIESPVPTINRNRNR